MILEVVLYHLRIITDIEYKIIQSKNGNLNPFKYEIKHLINCILKTIVGDQLDENDKVDKRTNFRVTNYEKEG